MPERTPAALAGKAKRVVGTFVLMLGAGMVLDAHAGRVGVAIMLIGGLAVAWGLGEGRAAAVNGVGADARMAEPTESRP